MSFEVFTKRMIPLVQTPYVTVQKRGTISMNKSAHHLLGEPGAVELLFDPEEKVMGFRAVEQTVEHAYAVRSMGAANQDASTFMISGTAFFKYYGIDTTEARRYAATMREDIMCLDLAGGGTVVTSNRAGRGGKNAAQLQLQDSGDAGDSNSVSNTSGDGGENAASS